MQRGSNPVVLPMLISHLDENSNNEKITAKVNEYISNIIKPEINLEVAHDLIYCSTITTIKLHNKICEDRKEIKKHRNKPEWQQIKKQQQQQTVRKDI
jgi:hypothetical protein